ILFIALFAGTGGAQTRPYESEEDQPRRIWAEAYTKKEKKVAVAEKKPVSSTVKRAKKREYKVATPQIVADAVIPETVVGITIWRYRPAREGEIGIQIGNDRLVAERVEGDTVLAKGEKVRLSIEAARDGYLYVINREQYADGTTGDPHLIYPTSRLTGGDNRTTIGRVFSIPAHADQPPYFTLTPGRPDQIAELISVLVTSEPIANVKISEQVAQLSSAQVTEWEQKWGKSVGRLEMQGGAGETITPIEQEAGTGARLLKHTDPPPQTLYYNPAVSAHDPVFVNVNLQYSARE
ncbi:MAG: hypothetical protein ACRD4B_07970, partial [Acidobacteriota bacterium]